MVFSERGLSPAEVRAELAEASGGDARWKERLAAGVSYTAGDDVLQVAVDAYTRFFTGNALYASLFPSLERFENEVVAMTAELMHADQPFGNITSGGSEASCWRSSPPAIVLGRGDPTSLGRRWWSPSRPIQPSGKGRTTSASESSRLR